MKSPSTLPMPSRQHLCDFRWIQADVDRLSRDHPNQWVAVHKSKVLATGRVLGKVKAAVCEELGDIETPVYFVDDGTIILFI